MKKPISERIAAAKRRNQTPKASAPPVNIVQERRDRHEVNTLVKSLEDKASANNDQQLQALERIYSAILSASAMKPAELDIQVTGRDSEGRIQTLRVTRPTMRDN